MTCEFNFVDGVGTDPQSHCKTDKISNICNLADSPLAGKETLKDRGVALGTIPIGICHFL